MLPPRMSSAEAASSRKSAQLLGSAGGTSKMNQPSPSPPGRPPSLTTSTNRVPTGNDGLFDLTIRVLYAAKFPATARHVTFRRYRVSPGRVAVSRPEAFSPLGPL